MKIVLLFFLLGIICGAIYGLCGFINLIFKKNVIVQFITDLIFSFVVGHHFLFAINQYFYGQIRIYIIAIFAFGLYLERKTLGKLFAKLYFILYNVGRKSIQGFLSTKLGKIIFK
jgi:hypothetical protein